MVAYQVILRVVILSPPSDDLYCLEDDQGRFISTAKSTGNDIVFDFPALVKLNRRTKNQTSSDRLAGALRPRDSFISILACPRVKKTLPGKGGLRFGLVAGPSMYNHHPKKSPGQWCIRWPLTPAKPDDRISGQADDGSPGLHGAGSWKVGLK